MATAKTGFQKVAGFFDSGGKMIVAMITLVIGIYTVSVFFYKLNQTLLAVDQIKIDQKRMHEEDIKDNKVQFEDQKELILKVMAHNRELEKQHNLDAIELAEWKGRVETLLKMK